MLPKKYFIMLIILIFLFTGYTPALAKISLQDLIDAAKVGETVELPSGTYTEPIVIDKAITVIGQGEVLLIANGDEPAVVLKNKGATLKNIQVENTKSEYGIFVSGSDHILSELIVKTSRIGIRLNEATNIQLSNSRVIGLPGADEVGNGIDLYRSVGNVITNNKVMDIRDGIYVEYSNANEITGNTITRSRYGLHFMYTMDNFVRYNTFIDNHTGSMIMVSYNEHYSDNYLLENRQNVNSQGLYLYDVYESVFKDNRINGNRIGVMIDNSFTNMITQNEVQGNAIGIIFKQSTDNTITRNDFINNVNTILTYGDDSKNNNLVENFWDNQVGLDADGDSFSDLEVVADPYFMEITDKNLSYQLFFQSPGVLLMEKLLKSNDATLIKDKSPVMSPNIQQEEQTKQNMGIMFISILFMVSSIIFYLMGRKKLQ